MCVVVVKEKEWRCVRSACVSFFCPLQMKKKSLDFLFGGHLEKKTRERTREKRDLSTRNLFSFTTLINSSLNQLSRTNEGTRNTRRALTTEKEERGPRFRDDARSSRFAVSICSGVYCLGILIKKVLEKRSSFSLL